MSERLTYKDEFEFEWVGKGDLPPDEELRTRLSNATLREPYGNNWERELINIVYLPQRRRAEEAQARWEAHVASGRPNVISLEGCDVAGSRGGYSRY